MKRIIISLVMLLGTISLAGPAQATNPDACTQQVLDTEAWDEKVIDQPYIPAKDAVTKTQYEFVHKHRDHPNSPRWGDDPNWNAESNPHSKGWSATGNTRVVVLEEAVPEQPEISHIVHHEATYKTVEVPCEEPPKPDPVVKTHVKDVVDCEAYTAKTVTVTKTWDWTLIDGEWVKDAEPTKERTVQWREVLEGECPLPYDPIFITVAAPVIHQPTCDNPEATVDFVLDGEHYDGSVDYPPYSSAPDVINVMAFAHDGVDFGPVGGPLYEIDGPGYWELTIDDSALQDCDPAQGLAATPEADQVLPDTGAPTLLWAVLGSLLMLAGASVLLLRKP